MLSAGEVLATWRGLPFADFDRIAVGPLLVLAPHPDDETLGCGGLIAEACARGREAQVAILTDGTRSHPNSQQYPAPRLKALRESEARAAAAALGMPDDRLHFIGLRDENLPHEGSEFDSVVRRLTELMASFAATTILATWRHDPHDDHIAAHFIAAAVARRTRARHLAYPVWGWTLPLEQPLPEAATRGVRLDISRRLETKRRAISAHASQMGGLITDDPYGACLPDSLLANFLEPFEVFLEAD